MRIINGAMEGVADVMSRSMEENRVPGAALAAIIGGGAAKTVLLGVKNADAAEPVEKHTFFEAASLTKPVFAYVVLQLAEKGTIELHRPLKEYGVEPPSEDSRFALATAAHVLSHGTGLPNWGDKPLSLCFAPGEGFGYSGSGYAYLQQVVEKLTDTRLDALMQQYAFNPLGMEHSTMIWTGAMNLLIAAAHDEQGKPQPMRNSARHQSGYEPNAAYSLYVDICEYPHFLGELLKGGYTRRIKSICNIAMHGVSWGLGWGMYENMFFHWGDNGGYKSLTLWDDSTGDALLIHTNGYNGLNVCFDAVSALTENSLAGIRKFLDEVE